MHFELQNPDKLYQAAKDGTKGDIAFDYLESPLHTTKLEMDSDGNHFNLHGTFEFAASSDATDKKEGKKNAEATMEQTKKLIAKMATQHNFDVEERGGRIIYEYIEDSPMVIGRGTSNTNSSQLHISNGTIIENNGNKADLVPRPELTKENFEKAIVSVTHAMGTVALLAYEEVAVKPTPEHKVIVAAPGEAAKNNKNQKTNNKYENVGEKFGLEWPKVSFEDIGGQVEAKKEMQSLVYAIANPELYEKWGATPAKGAILHGPPGTGKTLMAKAVASEADAAFYSVAASDVLSKWYGQSEQQMAELFDIAAKNKRAVICFDEIDAITSNRDGGHEATQRVMSVLLQKMDGIGSHNNVIVLATTNRLDSIDPAILRPGRFDKKIEVALPEKQDRQQIFDIHAKKANEIAKRDLFKKEVDFDHSADLTEGMSGADIAEVVRRVLDEKVRQEFAEGVEPDVVDLEDMKREIEKLKTENKTGKREIGFHRQFSKSKSEDEPDDESLQLHTAGFRT